MPARIRGGRSALEQPFREGAEFQRLEADQGFPRGRIVGLPGMPAHRGDEATDGVLDGPSSRIWPQAHNRMHTARGLLAWLLDESLR